MHRKAVDEESNPCWPPDADISAVAWAEDEEAPCVIYVSSSESPVDGYTDGPCTDYFDGSVDLCGHTCWSLSVIGGVRTVVEKTSEGVELTLDDRLAVGMIGHDVLRCTLVS